MTTAPANDRLRKTRVLLTMCLVYAAAMIVLAAFLASQHAWTQVAMITASSVVPLTVSLSAYAAAKRGRSVTWRRAASVSCSSCSPAAPCSAPGLPWPCFR
jgi:hypothetical protein